MKLFYLVVIILTVINTGKGFAQDNNGLVIEGIVTAGGESAEGGIVELYRNGQHSADHNVESNGRYRIMLELNQVYSLLFTHRSSLPQKIVVDTQVPQTLPAGESQFSPFSVNINLLPEVSVPEVDFTQITVMKVYYSTQDNEFISDIHYTDRQLNQLIESEVGQSQFTANETGNLNRDGNTDHEELRKVYNLHIQQAELEYKQEEFLAALDGYKAASKILPDEQYPKDRISEINDLLGLLMIADEREEALNARLNELLEQADLHYNQQNYEEAMAAYQRALTVDPGNNHAATRLVELEELIANARTNKEYDEIIVAADNAYDELLYENARQLYEKALQLKRDETYPQQRIDDVDKILEQLTLNAEKLEGYRESMEQAEKDVETQLYEEALMSYNLALDFKPGDNEALAKINEVKELMASRAQQDLYREQIKMADSAFDEGRYEDALAAYEKASDLEPAEEYPGMRINQINDIVAENERLAAEQEQARIKEQEAETERQYSGTMAKADSLFNAKAYESALEAYKLAMQIKPEEALPGRKIRVTEVMVNRQAANQQAYDAAIEAGDEAFEQEQFEAAKTAYLEARQILPDERYPEEMLSRIQAIEEEQVRRNEEAAEAERARLAALDEERERQYIRAIAVADSLYEVNDFEGAREAYLQAQQVNPDEELPGERIIEVDEAMSRIAEARDAYESAVAEGDAAYDQEFFNEAVSSYQKAQEAMPTEPYPGEMLARIDSVINARAQLAADAEAEAARLAVEAEQSRQKALAVEEEMKYNQALAVADSLLEQEDYEGARTAYMLAQQVKPEEGLPARKIAEIDNHVNILAGARKAFNDAVARGDEAFMLEQFDEAKEAFGDAQKTMPDESYPVEMLAKIDSIQGARQQLAAEAAENEKQEAEIAAANAKKQAEAEAAEQERLAMLETENEVKYNQAVSTANSLFRSNNYEEAREVYMLAQKLMPDESLPGARIAEIDELMAETLLDKQKYDDAIVRGDEAFDQELFEEASEAYQEALQIMPEEAYPANRLIQIKTAEKNRALAKAEAEAELAPVVVEAESDPVNHSTVTADAQEESAAEAEEVEKKRLAMLTAEKELQYNYAISRGDSHFNLKEYEQSLIFYNQALEVNNEAIYPRQRIAEINKVMSGQNIEQLEQEKDDEVFMDALQAANQHFDLGYYQQAIAEYERAQVIRPDAPLPSQRISEATRLLQQQQLEERYSNILLIADEMFSDENWEDAKIEYQHALDLKPDEEYPRVQMIKIDEQVREQEAQLLVEQEAAAEKERQQEELERQQEALSQSQDVYNAERNSLYHDYIALADEAFEKENYNVSRAWYSKAAHIKDNEAYPKQRIDEIREIVHAVTNNRQESEYQNYVNLADSAFSAGQYAVSRGWYYQALKVKPEADYPKEQLDVIARQVAVHINNKQEQQFNNNMQKAAEAFATGNYSLSKFWLVKALEMKPENTVAQEKLIEAEEYLK